MSRTHIFGIIVGLLSGIPALAAAQTRPAGGESVDQLIDRLAHDPTAQLRLEEAAAHVTRPGAEGERAALAEALAASLKRRTPPAARALVLRQLELVARDEATEAVASQLNDPDPGVRQAARRALQSNPSAAAGERLTAALDASRGVDRIGVIDALAKRREKAAAERIAALAADPDPATAAAAAHALAAIAPARAADVLAKSKSPAAPHALLAAADALMAAGDNGAALEAYRAASRPGMPRAVRAGALNRRLESPDLDPAIAPSSIHSPDLEPLRRDVSRHLANRSDVRPEFLGRVIRSSPEDAVVVLHALGDRGDPGQLGVIAEGLISAHADVRLAATAALGRIKVPDAAMLLVEIAASAKGAEQAAAREALEHFAGGDAAAAEIARRAAGPAAPAKLRAEAARTLGVWRSSANVDAIRQLMTDPDQSVRSEAIAALGAAGDPSHLDRLIGVLVSPKSQPEAQAAENAVAGVLSRLPDADARATPLLAALPKHPKSRLALLRLLGRTGSPAAVDVLRRSLTSTDKEEQLTALRAMNDWPDASFEADLLAHAKSTPEENQRVLALRGYLRALSHPNERGPEQSTKLYADLLPLARVEEKKLILSALGGQETPDALAITAPMIDDPAVTNEAIGASLRIARAIADDHPAVATPVLKRVATQAKEERTRQSADEVLRRIGAR